MKATKIILTAIAPLILLLPAISAACHIELEPDKDAIRVGDTVTIMATSILEHRNCVLEDDDYSLDLSKNATLLKQGTWTETKRGVFTNTFTIKITDTGLFSIRVYRDCSKKGISEGDLSYQVK